MPVDDQRGRAGRWVTLARMRKALLVLVFVLAVAAGGFLLANVGITPVAGAGLGGVVVAALAATRVPTERLLWATTCLFVVTVTWNGIRFGGGAFGNAFLVVAVASLVAHVVVTREPLSLPPWLLLAGLGFLLAQVLTLVFPPNVEIASREAIELRTLYPTPPLLLARSDIAALLKYEAAVVIVPVLLIAAGTTRVKCRRLLDLFAVSALVSAFVAVLALGGLNLAPTPFQDSRSAGLAIHPNYLGVGCTIAVPLTMLWLTRADIRWRLAGACALPVLLAGVIASGSRGGSVTILVGVVLSVALLPRLRRGLGIVLPVVGMIGIVVLLYTGVGHHILDQVRLAKGSDVSGADYARGYAADLAVEQIRARPFSGVGFSVIADAHDIYLELLAAGGIIALTSFLLFCGGLVSAARRGLRGPQRDETIAASLAVGLWLIGGVVGNELADKFLYVVPGILLALARVASRRPSDGTAVVDDPVRMSPETPIPEAPPPRVAVPA